jgi:uncharacterized protein (DUF3820 family)
MTPITLTLSSRIPFGQYKGRLVSDILKLDPKYLKWLWVEKKAITPDNTLKQRLKENMKIKQLREAIKQIIRKELNENQPAPSKPERETTTIPARPGTKEKPDEKRRKIGRPDVKPAPKNLKEEEMINKITARFIKAKKTNESVNPNSKYTPKFTDEQINKMTLKQAEFALKSVIYVPQNKEVRNKILARIKQLKK